jgi:hypothetical protein
VAPFNPGRAIGTMIAPDIAAARPRGGPQGIRHGR